MIDTFKVKILKGVGVAIVVILIFVIGFGVDILVSQHRKCQP